MFTNCKYHCSFMHDNDNNNNNNDNNDNNNNNNNNTDNNNNSNNIYIYIYVYAYIPYKILYTSFLVRYPCGSNLQATPGRFRAPRTYRCSLRAQKS